MEILLKRKWLYEIFGETEEKTYGSLTYVLNENHIEKFFSSLSFILFSFYI